MANYANILAEIAASIYTNDNEEITGAVLQSVLIDIVADLGNGYNFKGIAAPDTNHGTPDAKVWYIAPSGSYPNFGNTSQNPFIVQDGFVGVFRWDAAWTCDSFEIAPQVVNNLTEGGSDKPLSAEMGKALKDMLGDVGIEWESVNLGSYDTRTCSLGTSGWYGGGTHKAIPVTEGDIFRATLVSTASGNCYYGWLTSSYSPPYSDGSSIPYVSGTTRVSMQVGASNILTAPEGASYLVLVIKDGAGNSATWNLDEAISGSGTVEYQLNQLAGRLDDVDEILHGEADNVHLDWSQAVVYNQNRYYRYVSVPVRKGDTIQVSLNDFSTFDVAVAVTSSPTYGSTIISDTGWKHETITKVINADEDGRYCRIIVRYANNASISVETGTAAVSVLSAVRYAQDGGIIKRVDDLENPVPALPFKNLGGLDYIGKKIDVGTHTYEQEQIGGLSAGVSSRQGGAIYGNYLFQFHNTLETIVVYRLDTAQNVQVLNMTPMANCHAGSGGFSSEFYSAGDPFPLLYISSMDEKKVYVYRITGTEGSWSISLVQTITLSLGFYLPNIAIDAANGRGVIFGYAANSWSNPSANYSIICEFDLPLADQQTVTITKFDGMFRLPFIYAQQGGCARWGKLFLSFGNTRAGMNTGGIIVIDYVARNVDTYLDLLPMSSGNFEPEALGIWDGGLVVTEADGGIYKLTF